MENTVNPLIRNNANKYVGIRGIEFNYLEQFRDNKKIEINGNSNYQGFEIERFSLYSGYVFHFIHLFTGVPFYRIAVYID